MHKNYTKKICGGLFLFLAVALFCPHQFLLAGSGSTTVALNPVTGTTDLANFLESILVYLRGIIGFLAVMFIVIGGVLYVIAGSTGNDGLVTTAKSCWVFSIIGFVIAAAGPTFLKEIKAIVIPNGYNPDPNSAPTLTDIVSRALNFLLSILGTLGIIGLVVSGIMYIFSFGNSGQSEKAKNAMKYSIMGIVIAGAALIIIKQVAKLITG